MRYEKAAVMLSGGAFEGGAAAERAVAATAVESHVAGVRRCSRFLIYLFILGEQTAIL